MNPLEKKEDEEEDIGFTEWLTEDSTETSDEVAELIKVPGLETKIMLIIKCFRMICG